MERLAAFFYIFFGRGAPWGGGEGDVKRERRFYLGGGVVLFSLPCFGVLGKITVLCVEHGIPDDRFHELPGRSERGGESVSKEGVMCGE